MTVEQLNIVISAATLVVLLTAAVAAIIQLRHIRASNDLSTFSEAFELWYSPAVQEGISFIQRDLATKMEDPSFRRGLETQGPVDRLQHPEVNVLDYFDNTAILLVMGKMREDMIMQAAGQACCSLWETLSPAIAIMRRRRGPQLYASFEYLVWRSQLWQKRYPNGYTPKGFMRLPNPDTWLRADKNLPE